MPHQHLVEEMDARVRAAQDLLVGALERADGAGRFGRDAWDRPGGGGGISRVLDGGALLQKAGVNVSRVHGRLPPELEGRLPGDGPEFQAVGLSVVLHPRSPRVPTAHVNVRLLVHGGKAWFGGGSDLTPHYLVEEDARHFHRTWKALCDRHDPAWYPRFKAACDAYFHLPHRGEHRGVGGIFFEDLGGDAARELDFATEIAPTFLEAWLPIAGRRRDEPWGEREREWQEIRRGRYVEFNLLQDRGTVFGLQTGGRTESILMSLPPRVRWTYGHAPAPGSEEERLLEVVRRPREWA
jgi:coproporphyrinogen III oxidase